MVGEYNSEGKTRSVVVEELASDRYRCIGVPWTDPQGRPPRLKIVAQGDESSELQWIRSLTGIQRLAYLEQLRQQVIKQHYGGRSEFRRVLRVIDRSKG